MMTSCSFCVDGDLNLSTHRMSHGFLRYPRVACNHEMSTAQTTRLTGMQRPSLTILLPEFIVVSPALIGSFPVLDLRQTHRS